MSLNSQLELNKYCAALTHEPQEGAGGGEATNQLPHQSHSFCVLGCCSVELSYSSCSPIQFDSSLVDLAEKMTLIDFPSYSEKHT